LTEEDQDHASRNSALRTPRGGLFGAMFRAILPHRDREQSRPGTDSADPQTGADSESARINVGTGVEELRRRAMTLGFAVVTLAITSLLLVIYWQLARPILWAVTLAVLFYPLHRLVVRLVMGNESVGALISTLVILAVVVIPSVFLVIRLAGEVHDLWPVMRDGLGFGPFEWAAQRLEDSRFRGVAHFLIGGDPAGGVAAIEARLQEMAISVQDYMLRQLKTLTRNLPSVLVQMSIAIVAFYFFLRNGPAWVRGVQKALPLERDYAERLFGIAAQTINIVFRGVLVTAAAQAFAAGVGYWVVGAPLPVLFTILTFLAAVIPLVGAAAIWLPVAIGLFISGEHGAGIGLAIYGSLVVSLLDNFLKPFLIGRGMKLPLLWLFLAMIGGLKLFGFLGVVVGPMVLSLALAVYRIYQEGWRETTEASRKAGPPRVDPRARH
jgi:predicted PurR-regulated permease PerM